MFLKGKYSAMLRKNLLVCLELKLFICNTSITLGSTTCTSTPDSGIETAATTTPYSQTVQHTLSRSQCIPVYNIFNELNRAVTPLSDISNQGTSALLQLRLRHVFCILELNHLFMHVSGSSKRTREGWSTVKEGVLSQNTSNTTKEPPCHLNSPTLNLNERSSAICSGNASISGIIRTTFRSL